MAVLVVFVVKVGVLEGLFAFPFDTVVFDALKDQERIFLDFVVITGNEATVLLPVCM